MKKIIHYSLIVFLVILSTTVWAQSGKKLVLGEQEVFKVSKASSAILIDGKMAEYALHVA